MATIEEMAAEYANNSTVAHVSPQWTGEVENAYMNGAYAVLAEIEKGLPFSLRYRYANERIVEIIDRLKGGDANRTK